MISGIVSIFEETYGSYLQESITLSVVQDSTNLLLRDPAQKA
jgi:hypothetical protein